MSEYSVPSKSVQRFSLLNFTFSLSTSVSIKVEGMEVGLTAALKNQDGNLKLSVLECGCHVKDISIKLDGGASWLYQV